MKKRNDTTVKREEELDEIPDDFFMAVLPRSTAVTLGAIAPLEF